MVVIQLEHVCILKNEQHLEGYVEMIKEHYNNEYYDGTLFVLNYYFSIDGILKEKSLGNFKKYIYINLEHLIFIEQKYNQGGTQKWFKDIIFPTFEYYDEIWDFLIENKEYYPDKYKTKYKFMPFRYTSYYDTHKIFTKNDAKYDLLFIGNIDTPCRFDMINILTNNFGDKKDIKFKYIHGYGIEDVKEDVENVKFILDYPHYSITGNTQNCLRIYESLCLGKNVISFLGDERLNYFGDLITIIRRCDDSIDINELKNVIKNTKPVDNSLKFKELTYTDESFETYRKSFIKDDYIEEFNDENFF